MKLGELLIQAGLVTENDVQRALNLQQQTGGRLGSILIRLGALSEDALLKALTQQTGLHLLSNDDLPSPSEVYSFMATLEVRLDWLLDNNLLLWEHNGDLHMLAKDLNDSRIVDLLAYLFPHNQPKRYLGRTQDIDNLIGHVRRERGV